MIVSFFKKLSKKAQIISTAFVAVTILLCFFIFNLENNLSFIAKHFFEVNLKIENIDLSFNKLKATKLKIYDKSNRLMIDIPEINLSYSILKLKLKELDVNSPSLFIINDDSGINIKESFKTEKKKEENKSFLSGFDEKEKSKKYNAKDIPIEKIKLNNLMLNYKIQKNEIEETKILKNIIVNIESGENKGISATLKIDENQEKVDVFYKNHEEPLYLELKVSGVNLENYKSLIGEPKIKKLSGEINIDAILSSKNRAGHIKLENFGIYYEDIESDIKADINIELEKEDVYALVDYEIFDEKDQMEVMYKDGKLYSLIQIKNVNESKLSKIGPLKRTKLDLSKIDIADIIFLTQYSIEEGFRVNFDLKPNKVQIGAITLDKMKANLIIKDGIKTLEDSNIFLKIADMPTKLELGAKIKDNITDVSFQIKNLDKMSNLIEDFSGIAKIENRENVVIAKVESNIINFDADYQKETGNLKFYNKDFNLDYNRNEKKFYGEGEVDFSIYGLKNNIKYSIKDDKVNFDKIRIENKKNKNESLDANGYYDLTTKDFKFDYDSTDLEIRRYYKDQEILFSFQGKGKFERIHSVLTGIGNVKGLNLKYFGDVKSLTGQYSFGLNDNNELEVEFNGKIAEMDYGKYKLKNVLVKLGFERDILKIKKMGNEFFNLSGEFNRSTQESNLKLDIKNLNNKELGFEKLDFNIKDIRADINGSLDNPNIKLNIKDTEILIQNKIARLHGDMEMYDKKINISNLNLGSNKLRGKYNLETKDLNATLILNDNLSNYIKNKDVDYKIKGEVSLVGKEGNINSNINIRGEGVIQKTILPNTHLIATYTAKNYSDGIIKLKALEIKNDKDKKLANFIGDINLNNKTLQLESRESINFYDLKSYIKNDDLEGEMNTNIEINGELNNPNYSISFDSNKITFKDNSITEFNSKLIGDKQSINIQDLSFKYYENKFLGKGLYNFEDKAYDFLLYSKDKIDLSTFNDTFKDKGLNGIKGSIDINLGIDNSGFKGYLKIDSLGFKDEKEYIRVSDFKSDVILKNNQIVLKDTLAKINDGELKIGGYIEIPKEFKNLQNIKYSINMQASGIKYEKSDVIKTSFDSQINLSDKKLQGNIFINNGVVYDIPNDYKSLLSIIRKKILNKKEKDGEKNKITDKELENKSKKNKVETVTKKIEQVNINLRTREPILLDIDDFNIAIGEVRGKLYIDLSLIGGKGKYNVKGNSEIQNGYIYVNTNKFILDRALISFNDSLTYLPEINPDIFFDSRVTMDEEEINFGVYGRLKKLIYSLSSDNGNLNGSFNSLLSNSGESFYYEGDVNKIYTNFMKNIIAGQLTKALFDPVTKTTKKILGLSRLTIKPEVSVYNEEPRIVTANISERNTQVYDLGARVEAEKELYKESLYLYGTARLWGSNKTPVIKSSLEKNGIQEYDVGLEYRTKDDKVFGIGVGTVPQRYVNEDRNQKARNYHVDFKIRKKYNSFSEMFSF